MTAPSTDLRLTLGLLHDAAWPPPARAVGRHTRAGPGARWARPGRPSIVGQDTGCCGSGRERSAKLFCWSLRTGVTGSPRMNQGASRSQISGLRLADLCRESGILLGERVAQRRGLQT